MLCILCTPLYDTCTLYIVCTVCVLSPLQNALSVPEADYVRRVEVRMTVCLYVHVYVHVYVHIYVHIYVRYHIKVDVIEKFSFCLH